MAFEYLIEDKVRNLKVMCNSAQMVKLFIVLNIFHGIYNFLLYNRLFAFLNILLNTPGAFKDTRGFQHEGVTPYPHTYS